MKLRRDAGQHQLVSDKLKQFPTEGVGGEILQGVREMIAGVRHPRGPPPGRRQAPQGAWPSKLTDTIAKENLKPILDEIAAEIGPNTLDRMAAFLQNADDAQTPDAEKVALAISGWLLGADAATDEAAHGDLGLQGPRPDPRVSQRDDRARPRADLQLHQAGVGRRRRRWWPSCWPT